MVSLDGITKDRLAPVCVKGLADGRLLAKLIDDRSFRKV